MTSRDGSWVGFFGSGRVSGLTFQRKIGLCRAQSRANNNRKADIAISRNRGGNRTAEFCLQLIDLFVFLFYFFLNNKTGLQHINIQISSIAYLMNRKNYCWAESGFLMKPRFCVGFGLTSSGSGRVRTEPTRPDSISDNVISCDVTSLSKPQVNTGFWKKGF